MSMGLFSLALRVINISGGFGNVKNALVFNIGKLRFPWGSQGPRVRGRMISRRWITSSICETIRLQYATIARNQAQNTLKSHFSCQKSCK